MHLKMTAARGSKLSFPFREKGAAKVAAVVSIVGCDFSRAAPGQPAAQWCLLQGLI